MDKDALKLMIAEYQRYAAQVELVPRPYVFEDALNYVFVGLRRAGKSFLMFQRIRQLLKAGHSAGEVLYFNFEDDRLPKLETELLERIKTCYEEMFDCRPIFFLDEVQLVPGWEKFVRRLADQKYRVYVTGSNAKMLSAEIATTLGGRFMVHPVYPCSFPEFLTLSGINATEKNARYRERVRLVKAFENYLRSGGLPELVHVSGKREWLSNLYQKIFFGDLVSRYQIRNDFALRVLVRKLAESVKQPSSFTRLAHVVSASGKRISTDTVIDYLGYLKESWLIFPLENYSAKLADRESNKKHYFVDNGILNLFLLDPVASLLENLVAIQLRKRYGDEVYYYHSGIEVDFVVPDRQLAVQVCTSLADPETKEREVDALQKLSKRCPIKNRLIVTQDEEADIQTSEGAIEVVPAWKWLLRAEESERP